MTLNEAKKIAAICSTADDGCPYCIEALRKQLASEFPEFLWSFEFAIGTEILVEPRDEPQA